MKVLDKYQYQYQQKDKDKDKSRNSQIMCYDFVGEVVGGWMVERPWVVVVWDFYGKGRVEQINMLDANRGGVSKKGHRI